ncbi:hypothetical protein [Proteus vulgaris]|uniref:hypothetical protein n=1 Tax=Proteus vulgaris TaxID=585 RepID=UPI0013D7BBA6|nr:hypothetical protein [Proteus vulgaris]
MEMDKEKENEYRERLLEFFYPFLANVELGNISATENAENLVNAFISFYEDGYFSPPYL